MDRFESMRAFTRVVEAGGFAAAAREIGLTRSAVNKLVMNLENDLGVQLLHRTTRKVTPTDTGIAFYERCVAILADLEEAELAVTQLHEEPKGTLRINAPMSFGTLHLAPLVADFLGQYPDLRIELVLSDRIIDPIEEGFDITVRIAQPPESAHLIVHELAQAPMVICGSPSYLAQKGIPNHPQDLKHHNCLHYGHIASTNYWQLIGPDGEHQVKVHGPLCSNNGEVLRDAAIKGQGLVLLPIFIVGNELQQAILKPVLEKYYAPKLSISILYPVNRHLSTKVTLFTEFLSHSIKNNPLLQAQK
ncbi:LysR family transcriptional regulator [Pseudanabaena sp. FACHB-2040]|uniref:LysR family transcriptional regulator n=1 Tax=Pseudanabaena sp. FACHB-2040 TaxID=2692859 RepID=UPI001684FB1A|nr:LysR family transcriptional regulator [Pseudanabaena sp. FACHB-2040]MBD2257613.1 LysR family transcriptional regulator [Pseudanabaena sp. FACHB-2040]